jgi:hypothetical protein
VQHGPPGFSGVSDPVPPGAGTLYFYEVSIFFDLFNPNNRHRTEELRRLENTREDESPGEPGRGPIDLNSGTVLIRVPEKDELSEDDAAPRDGMESPEDTEPDEDSPEDAARREAEQYAAYQATLQDENVPEDGDAAALYEEDGGA